MARHAELRAVARDGRGRAGLIAVVPCGSAKGTRPTAAGNLYTGSFHKACMAYALSVVPKDRILILSAKHGLVAPTKVLAPYELRFGTAGAVTRERIAEQAREMGVAGETAIILGGKDYAAMTAGAFAGRVVVAETIAREMPNAGLGYSISWLGRNRGRALVASPAAA